MEQKPNSEDNVVDLGNQTNEKKHAAVLEKVAAMWKKLQEHTRTIETDERAELIKWAGNKLRIESEKTCIKDGNPTIAELNELERHISEIDKLVFHSYEMPHTPGL